jgi:hypothetical protein
MMMDSKVQVIRVLENRIDQEEVRYLCIMSMRETVTLLRPKDTYRIFIDITFSGSILSNLVTGANQTTHFPPPGE